MRRLPAAVLVAALIAAAALAMASVTGALSHPKMPVDLPAVSPAKRTLESGMVIAIDPETGQPGMPAPGQLGPALSMSEAEAYARQLASELVTLNHPDGSSTLIHDERLADYAVIRISPDGSRQFLCVHGEHAANGALCTTQPVSPASEEK